MSTLQQAYIVAATRSPIGKAPRGVFAHTRPDDLLAKVIRGLLAQAPGLDPAAIEDCIVGCAIPEGPQGFNVARIGALLAGLPVSVAGVTVNRFCASGLTAIAMAADRIRVGEADVIIAAGTESMSQVPVMGVNTSFSPEIFARDENLGIAYGMGLTAEQVAERWKVSREDQDAFALRSHERALAAQRSGEFSDEILPIEVVRRTPDPALGADAGGIQERRRTVELDEGPRADTSIQALSRLRPAFAARGSVTAGNSSQMSDGAGALLVVSERALKTHGLQPIARFVSFAVKGVPPEIMGIGPREAIPQVLRQAGLSLGNMGWIELNEAFAAQALAVIRELGLDPEIVNPLGGAIALGHPLGATGAIRAATLVHGLRRRKLDYGMLTMCVGTGMGAAGIFQRM
ncbi:acetyl-CoA C-acyltransferase [Parapusillimonas granuli]|uniref:acetyl-CoA C-acyltransferase n=1 Tax=Parapusillimonas granuli TaxID=380911 RepID=A0A853FZD5_9BURK|nr:acetyl-CoA C-acyltransferase [Parapusillimonas granuli]MBB5216398.1 acetyl-CoA acyltransferase [Parapusillimonas granuli]NYT51465.1 acetyl-CoA C-acyltransferase [Parapusillimonas granuli]